MVWLWLHTLCCQKKRKKTEYRKSEQMKTKYSSFTCLAAIALAAVAFSAAVPAHAATIGTVNYGDPTVAIFGTGNPDGSWTSATSGNASVALRFKERGTGNMNNDGAGTYSFPVGTNVNVEFSASSGTQFLDGFKYLLAIDSDPTAATLWTVFDPVAWFGDNSWGTSSTLNSAGVETGAILNQPISSVVQNSQRDIWFGFHPAGDATYNMAFTAYSASDANYERPLARTEATLKVGNGAQTVPDAGSTVAMLAFVMCGMVMVARKQRR